MSEFKYPYGRRRTDEPIQMNPFPDSDWKESEFDFEEYQSTALHIVIGVVAFMISFFAVIGFADVIKFVMSVL